MTKNKLDAQVCLHDIHSHLLRAVIMRVHFKTTQLACLCVTWPITGSYEYKQIFLQGYLYLQITINLIACYIPYIEVT